jgi:hypothetical protein
MQWQTLTIHGSLESSLLASSLLAHLSKPLVRSTLHAEAMVIRARGGSAEQFLFSPAAAAMFRALIESYAGQAAPLVAIVPLSLEVLSMSEVLQWVPLVEFLGALPPGNAAPQYWSDGTIRG